MAAPAKPINLLPASDFELSFWGKFLHWAVTSGRYIIIVTEIVVILAFLSRFKLDRDLDEIKGTIKQQQDLLTRQKPIENEFRLTQARLDTVDMMLKDQLNFQTKNDKLISSIPTDVKVVGILFKKDTITIQAKTLDESAIAEMLARLGRETTWKEIEMTSFSTTPDELEINFSLVIRS